ncbi:hypothetical protein [Planctomicrobium piriforme]|uniref:Uncharacterized protein n=1 Tax=Planctomicrobium piriforme TaxID=1576369 RepID=A0A1I3LZR6_9PLAN|nr:hypothetical protein [Planctomicrobium piriforme]SFI90040.1 hypothetical protein SAMN05421753_113112 [Planctomicrobium piriforme]
MTMDRFSLKQIARRTFAVTALSAALGWGFSPAHLLAQRPIYRPIQAGPQMTPPGAVQPPVAAVPTQQSIRELASRHPLCIIVGERLASQYIGTETNDEGPFQDFILGANIQGTQKTNTKTKLDFVSNASVMRLHIVLNGVTVSQTLSQTPQAAIQSAGNIEFQVSKQVEFDGSQLKTWSPAAFLTIRQQHLGASTPVSQVPLLGPLVNNIAMNAAEQRRPMAEQIAAQRVTQKVAPTFNERLDQELIKLNQKLSGDVKTRLENAQLVPSHIATLSSEDAGMWGVAFETATPQAAGQTIVRPASANGKRTRVLPARQLLPAPDAAAPAGVGGKMDAPAPFSLEVANVKDRALCLFHESAVADIVARYDIGGKEIPSWMLKRFLSGATADPNAPALGTIVLAQQSPITAQITGGELLVTIRAGFKPVVGPEIPAQAVVFAVRPVLTTDQIVMKPELRSIKAVDQQAGGSLGAVAEGVLRQALEPKLKEYTLPRNVNVPRQEGKPQFAVRLQSLTLADGWMSFAYEAAPNAPTTPIMPAQSWQPTRTTMKTPIDQQAVASGAERAE